MLKTYKTQIHYKNGDNVTLNFSKKTVATLLREELDNIIEVTITDTDAKDAEETKLKIKY